MENEVKLTKLASCAGCGAKVGAGTSVSYTHLTLPTTERV